MTIFLVLFLEYVSFDQNNEKYFNFIGSNEQLILKRGRYKIDIYGAQGGFGYGDGVRCGDGGKGAHVSAEFYITSENSKQYYVIVGSQGVPNNGDAGKLSGPNKGGYNGGGSGGQDAVWNPSEDQNDGPGGGGGATDIRTNVNDYSTRLIVAGGGSGGTWWDGNPGGGLCGIKRDSNGNLVCSSNTNTIVSGANKCINTNGIGGNGADSFETPRGGGGGGFCGGFSDNGEEPKYPFTSDSGSSYAKECQSNGYEKELCFFNVVMNSGIKTENGLVKITRIWECKDENCLYCKDANNKCEICKNNFLYYNDGCVSKCPSRTIQDGNHCYDCEEGCDVCTDRQTCTKCINGYYLYKNDCLIQCPKGTFVNGLECSPCSNDCDNCTGSASFCLECKDSFFFYNNRCYLNCNLLNNENKNEYFGKNNDDHKCQKCSDKNCIDCSNNYKACNKCSSFYYLDKNKCIHMPTKVFTYSNYFTKSDGFSFSNKFSNSVHFTVSDKFSNSVCFTVSNKFSNSDYFTTSNKFSNSAYFTVSNKFSESNCFTISNVFTNSNIFSESIKFSFSNKFSNSAHFTVSNDFSETNHFTISNFFTNSNVFSGSIIFSLSNQFSSSANFSFSSIFTKSEYFTFSNTFSSSNVFTKSMTFTTPFRFRTTISESQIGSYTLIRSVSFSISFYYSEIHYVTKINNEFSFISTKSFFISYFPYIIKFYSLTDRPTILIFEIPPRKGISAEVLIGICCGCASVFFFILAIIIMIYKKKYKRESDDLDFSISDEIEIKSIPNNEDVMHSTENMITMPISDSENDLKFWL